MIVLVTGFEPFLRHRRNPTERLAREADGRRIGQARIVGKVLPTRFRGCERELARAIAECRPDCVLMFGLAPARKKLAIEAMALNMDHSEDPDNGGERRWRRPIARGGPKAIETRMPVDRLYRALRKARVPAAVSYNAGTYVCNHAYYVAMRLAGRVGFLHVPPHFPGARLRRALEALVKAIPRR